MTAEPHPVVECAFFSQYASIAPAWTDITEFVRDDQSGLVTTRGRQESTQKFNAGTVTVPLDNRFGVFDDKNVNSPFYPNLLPMKALRVSKEYPGIPGLIPDPRFQEGISNWGTTTACSIAWAPPTFAMQRGLLRMTQTGGVANPVFKVNPLLTGWAIGKVVAASVRLVRANLTGSATPYLRISFYSNTGGTSLISESSTNGAQVNTSTNEVRLSHYATVPGSTLAVRVTLGWTAASTTAIIADYSSAVFDQLVTATSPTFAPLATGFVDSWPKTWDNKDSVVTMTASDGLKVLGLAGMTTPAYVEFVKGLSVPPSVYMRMHEEPLPGQPATDVRFLDEYTGAAYAQVNYVINKGPLFGADGSAITDVDTGFSAIGASSNDVGACLLSAQLSPSGISPWTFNIWFKYIRPSYFADPHPAVGDYIFSFGRAVAGNTTPSFFSLEWRDGGTVGAEITQQSPSRQHIVPGTTVVDDGLWHMITVVSTGTVYNLYVDGLLTGSAAYISTGATVTPLAGMMPGGVAATPGVWPPTQTGTGQYDEIMLWRATALDANSVSALFANARNVYPQERADQRVTKVLDLIAWPAADRNISVLGATLSPVGSPFFEANPLQYLQKIEDSDGGLLFMDAYGKVTFVDAATLLMTDAYVASHSTWTPGGPLTYEEVDAESSDKTLFTRAVISREGGTKQIADVTKVEYGYRPISKSTINFSDEEALWLGYWYLDHYKRPASHINSMVVNPLVSEAVFTEVMALEIGNRITVTVYPPPGVASYDYVAMIQGIRHEIRRGRWRTIYDLSDQWGIRYERFGDVVGLYPMGL